MAYLYIFITIFLFSTVEVFTKLINGNIDPIFLAFLRFFIVGFLISIFNYKKFKLISKKDFIKMGIWGIVGVSLALGFFHMSMESIEASKGAVIFSLNPLFSSIGAVFILNEKFKMKSIFGIVLGVIGTYVLVFGFDKVEMIGIKGAVLMFLSAVLFGVYVVAAKSFSKKYGAVFTTGVLFLLGSVFYIPFIKTYNLTGGLYTISIVAYLSIMATGVAYISYFYGLRTIPVSAGSSVFFIKPVLASIFSVLLLGEKLYMNFYIGISVIFLSLIFTIFEFKNFKRILS